MTPLLTVVAVLEMIAGSRAALRMLTSAGGRPLEPAAPPAPGTIAVVVPVLNEERRVGPALAALSRCGEEVGEIVVVDGGSSDGTRAVVAAASARDGRVRFVGAAPAPPGWNGKAWNLEVGARATSAPWIATIDADVRPTPAVLADALGRAREAGLVALSVATRQELADHGTAMLHPAFLTTLVYRAGLPNTVARDAQAVQANGQLFLARRDALERADAFRTARSSLCEDVTIARALAALGGPIGFYEGDAVVRMHDSWRDCAGNWPRSLTLRDQFVAPWRLALSLTELTLAQALPLPTLLALIALRRRVPFAGPTTAIVLALVAMRIGVLAGTRRAYLRPPLTYWLSPLADLPAVALLIASALRRRHRWRGRILVAPSPE
ncbi:MAG TPA: glycosyltransferase family 2 protein [Candidatus Acidoferrum sp.]|nr:glycosyltransferase family 2 protein [Candidatus Acidoferrum sp.]